MTDNNYYEIDLDIWGQFPLKKITTKQLDIGRKIRINLFSNGFTYNVSNSEVVFYMKKGNENIVFNSCNTIKNNIIEIEITSAMVDNPGNYEIEIHVISGGISTFKFELTVEETIMDTKAITSTSEYLALVNAYKKYNELISQIAEASGNIEEKYTTRLNKIDKRLKRLTRKLKATFNLAEWWVMGSDVDSYLSRDNAYITRDLELFKSMGVDGISLCVYGAYGKDKSVSSTTDNWYMIHKLDTVKHACSECKRLGLNIEHLKFMLHDATAKVNVIKKIDTFKPFWKNVIDTYCSALSEEGYKPSVVTCFNELATVYSSATYKDFVLEVLEIPKEYKYKASISCLNIGEIITMDKDITDKLDVFCSNIYPKGSYNGASATVEEQVQCWDRQVTLVKALKEEYPNKEIYITETGLRDTWEALANPGDYNLVGTGYTTTYGEVSALFLKGLFESEVMDYVASVTYWYFDSLFNTTTRKMFEPIKTLFMEYMGVVFDE